jgi:hypothetical protein
MHIIPRDWLSRLVYKTLAVSTVTAACALMQQLGQLTPAGV